MNKSKYLNLGKPVQETYRDAVLRLTNQVESEITRKYKGRDHDDKTAYDCFEKIIKEHITHYDEFNCSRKFITEKILAVHDVSGNQVLSLFIGPYPVYQRTVLEKLSEKITASIYETGMKEEILHIMFSFILREMKKRFGHKKSGYVFIGIEGNREEGIIKLK